MQETDLADVLVPGTIVAGKYEVVRLLGRGGMGVVVEARHLRLGQHVALKLLKASVRSMADVGTRFEREGRAAARLQGPHVARILDVDVLPDGSPFMVMELLRGRELADELAERGTLPVREAVGYLLQACAGMAEAHRAGIVHRDLKPSNLFLCENDGRRTLKVLDFGISKLAGEVHASVTTTASAFGTPLYMSPEQVRSAKHVDVRADVWSLGVVLYELLTGEPPFNGASATGILAAIIADKPVRLDERRPDVPSGLSKAVMRALEKDPSARWPGVLEFAAAIAPYGPPLNNPSMTALATELASPRPSPPSGPIGSAATASTVPVGGLAPAPSRRRAVVSIVVLSIVLSVVGILLVQTLMTPAAPTAGPEPLASTRATAAATASATAAPTVEPIEPATTAGVAPTPPTALPTAAAAAVPTPFPGAGSPAPSTSHRKPTAPPTAPTPVTTPTRPVTDPKYL